MDSLCKYYKMLWKICVNMRLNLSDNEISYIITHINDLEELFFGNKFFRDEE